MSGGRVEDMRWMGRALELAEGAVGLASPNPTVGCVLVGADGEVVGEGAHRYAERNHAEIAALKDAVRRERPVRGATAYVTLEPCAHHGRTGPCAVALVEAGVRRVVVATTDPNPLVAGRGMEILRTAGVEVKVGVGAARARELNLGFAQWIQHGRPLVTMKAAVSVDGYLAPPPAMRRESAPVWLTGSAARAEVHRLRHAADAIVTGIGTVLADDPALTDRSGLPRRRPLLRVVLDPRLRTSVGSKVLAGGPEVLLLCAEAALEAGTRRELESVAGVTVRAVPATAAGRMSLPAVLALLGEMRCLNVLLEAGSALNAAFLHADLVDRAVLYFAQRELGAGSVPFAAGGPSPYLLRQRMGQVRERELGPDVEVSGMLHDPWPAAP